MHAAAATSLRSPRNEAITIPGTRILAEQFWNRVCLARKTAFNFVSRAFPTGTASDIIKFSLGPTCYVNILPLILPLLSFRVPGERRQLTRARRHRRFPLNAPTNNLLDY